jgi:hypothetical protein
LDDPQVIQESFGYARPRLEGEMNIQVGRSTRDMGVGTHVELAPALEPPAYTLLADPPADAVVANPLADAVMANPLADTVIADPLADVVMADPSVDVVMADPSVNAVLAEPPANVVPADPTADAVLAEPSGSQDETQDHTTPPHSAGLVPSTPVPPLPLPPSAPTPSKYTPEPEQRRRAAPPRSPSPCPTPQVDSPTTPALRGEVETVVQSQTQVEEHGVDTGEKNTGGDDEGEGDKVASTEVEVKRDGMDDETDDVEVVEVRIGEAEVTKEPGEIEG